MDLKPQNIVIDEYLHAKLIDFSISINYGDKSMHDKIQLAFKGTKFYMPLEIINSKIIEVKDLNKVDSYALGVILFNLAFGYYPYDIKHEDDYDTIEEKIRNNKLEIKNENNLSSHFVDFIKKLLKKDINERMSIYEAMNHYWIKGGNILYDEKEKLYNIYSFTTKLITDNIKEFNDYLSK
jgi:serine/threonine protein kinase